MEAYRMIFVNVIASSVLLFGILLYRKLFPTKRTNLLYLLILASLLPLISILRSGAYESGDFSLHVKIAMQFFDNLSQGNFIPRWTAQHCETYGCPVYIFIFPLPYYIISALHAIGLSFIASVKFLIASSFILSGIGMYVWMRDELNEKAGFVAAIFYLYAPYHLIDLHFRVSIGELLSMVFMPFAFYFSKKIIETKKSLFFILNSAAFALLILSHQVTAFVCLPLLFFYSLIVWKRNKNDLSGIFITIGSLLMGIALSAFYTIPVLLESKFTWYKIIDKIIFDPLSSFIYSPNRFGFLFQGHSGELYLNIGYVQWIIIIVSIVLLLTNKIDKQKRLLTAAAIITFVIFFLLMQKQARPVWELFSFLKNFQFSWRLMVEIILLTSVIAGIVVAKINRSSLLVALCLITVGYTILNWGNRRTLPNVNDSTLRKETLFDNKRGNIEITTPKWVDQNAYWIGKIPKNHIEVLSGSAKIKQIKRNITRHEYIVNIKNDALVKENTFYYPGWEVTANNKPVNITYTNSKYPGVITFFLPKGLYNIEVAFKDTLDRSVSKFISLISLILLLILIVDLRRSRLERFKKFIKNCLDFI